MSSAVPIFSWIADVSGHVISLDADGAQFLGRPLADEVGDGWMQYVHPDDQAILDRYRAAVAAGRSFSLEYRCRLANGVYVWLQRTGVVQRGPEGSVTGFTGLCLDITDQKQGDTRAHIFQDLIAALSRAVTPRQVAQAIIDKGARPIQAHLVSVVLIDSDGTSLQLVNPDALPDDLAPDYQVFQRDYHGPLTDVFRTNEPIWIELQDEFIQRYPKVAAAVRRTESHASAVFPLLIRDRTIGSLSISFPAPRTYSDADRAFFTAIAHHCALALERARLYETEQQLRRQAEHHAEQLNRTQWVVAALSQAVTPHEVAGVILNQGREALGASAGSVVVPSPDGTMLELIRAVGYTPEAEQRWKRFPLNKAVPLAVAARTRTPLWLRTAEDWIDAIAWTATTTRDERNRSWTAIPLLVGERVIGALGFSFPTEHTFDAEERSFILSLAYHCAQALERARLFEAEAQARQTAEEANDLKLRFLAMVSHELRTPLASIKGFTSTLLAPDIHWDEERSREFLTIINQESDKLTDLIEQLLDLSRVQAGTLRIQQKPYPLAAVLDVAMAQLNTLTANHVLHLNGFQNAPTVLVDVQRIAQVLVNLVDNAVKYSPPGTPIVVTACQPQDHVQIDVTDCGDGIPPEAQPLVFEAFRRAGRSSGNGAGLGLAICKGVIETHGGRIWIDGQRSDGTTICFTLPLATQGSTGA